MRWSRDRCERSPIAVSVATAILFLVGAVSLNAFGTVLYVDIAAVGANDGSSWADAFTDLQDALAAAADGDEIWVAEGTYKPTTGTDRTASFILTGDLALYGGFAGGETARSQRDWEEHATILSGDLLEDDGPDWTNRTDNSHRVITSGGDCTVVLDGFVVQSAHAVSDWNGGGMCNLGGSATVTHCTFSGNWAADWGGGMYNYFGSPTVTDCTFSNNEADRGGGMYNYYSRPTVTHCTFSNNEANRGGGMYNEHGHATVTDCTFFENRASGGYSEGGGMHNEAGSPTVTGCLFSGNSSEHNGGGMFSRKSDPTVVNCTFSDNGAGDYGGGMLNTKGSATVTNCTFFGNTGDGGGMYNKSSDPTMKNTILAGNSPDDCLNEPEVTFNSNGYNLESGTSCGCTQPTDQQNTDPLLGPLTDNGGPTPTHALLSGSPALDAIPAPYNGAPDTDQRGFPRPYPAGGLVDIGAVEMQQAHANGDVNGDGSIDLLDVVLCQQMVSGLVHGTPGQQAAADVDDDGDVDADDVTILSEYVLGIRTTLP
jgi:predicted outer membrane repeat protein